MSVIIIILSITIILISFVIFCSSRYLTGINETAEDMALHRKPGCPKLEVKLVNIIEKQLK